MRVFKDRSGRPWTVSIDVAAIKRVRSMTSPSFNLVSTDFGATLKALADDPVLLVDVLYIVCKPEADLLKVSDEDFGRAMSGDSVEAGAKALFSELADFTPNPRDRARVKKLLESLDRIVERAADLADATMNARLADLLSGTANPTPSGSSSGSSPE